MRTKLFINGNRNGYDTEQCGRTMTVCELMAYLDQFDDDTPVYLKNDNGYTYGSIREEDFSDDSEEDEEEIKTMNEVPEVHDLYYVTYTMKSTLTGEIVNVEEQFDTYSEAESFFNKEKRIEIYGWIKSDFAINVLE